MSMGSESPLTGFSDLISCVVERDDGFAIDLPADWLQGRTSYGGLSAALCLEATTRSLPNLPPLRSAQFQFIGPAMGELKMTAEILRAGKSTVFSQAQVSGEMGIATQASFCFGLSRQTSHDFLNMPAPEALAPEVYPAYFTWPNRPNFMKHFEGRLVSGARPCTADQAPEMLVWLRHKDRNPQSNLVSLLALADALPPAIFATYQEPVPISTVSWSVDFLDESFENESSWWLVRSIAESARFGFSTQVISIWKPDGTPVLSARQNVAIFGNPKQIKNPVAID